ncbi:MAG: ribosome recycling factor [Aggregatilineales bacterium]
MIQDVLKEAEAKMKGAIHALEEHLGTVRTGRASPALVEKLLVEYYGTPTPLYQVATINIPEPMMITIKPFDKTTTKAIEKAIQLSDLHLTPNSDGQVIRLALPMLTVERRKELVKVVHVRIEEAKVALRNIRRNSIEDLRELQKEKLISEDDERHGQEQVNKLTERYTEQIETIGKHKEDEVMAV